MHVFIFVYLHLYLYICIYSDGVVAVGGGKLFVGAKTASSGRYGLANKTGASIFAYCSVCNKSDLCFQFFLMH